MTWQAELTTIEAHFDTQWAGATSVQYENAPFTPPSDQSEYVRLQVLQGESALVGYRGGVGQGLYRHVGVVQVDIFTPQSIGGARALELADNVAAIFRGQRVGDVLFRNPSLAKPVAEDGYFRVAFSCDYQRDEIL